MHPQKKTIVITFRITEEENAELAKVANALDMNKQDIVQWAIDCLIAAHNPKFVMKQSEVERYVRDHFPKAYCESDPK